MPTFYPAFEVGARSSVVLSYISALVTFLTLSEYRSLTFRCSKLSIGLCRIPWLHLQIDPSKARSRYRKLKYAEDLVNSMALMPLECIQFSRTVVKHDDKGRLYAPEKEQGGQYDPSFNLVLRQMVVMGVGRWRPLGDPLRMNSLKVGRELGLAGGIVESNANGVRWQGT
jgi:hypothetical protein